MPSSCPAYNSDRFLLESLESISAQERRPDEVLVVDEGSEDNTLAIAEQWAARQAFRVKLLANEVPHLPQVSRGPADLRRS